MAAQRSPRVIVITGSPDSPELEVLKRLDDSVEIVAVGKSLDDFQHLSPESWAGIDVLLNCGVGAKAGKRADIQAIWPRLTGLKWMHSASAGLENVLFPELIASDVVLTNAKGVYSHSLAEYALTCCNWFAKDLPRVRAAQKEKRWAPFDVEELRGKTMGIIGYGDIGRACGRLAKAFLMDVIALRRNTQLTEQDEREGVLKALYGPEDMLALVAKSDYIVMATPFTPQTHKLFSADAVAAMKPNAVFINVGRGKCVDEPALVMALQEGKIRGAGLDVFYEEPLPADSPLYTLDNVLMTPHCADQTKEFQFESLKLFLQNMKRYQVGESLCNVVDKEAGY